MNWPRFCSHAITLGLLLLSAALLSVVGEAALLSMSAGRVSDEVVTSREVMITYLIEQALFEQKDKPAEQLKIKIDSTQTRQAEFVRETTATLLEVAIDLEASNYKSGRTQITDENLRSQSRQVQSRLRGLKIWRELVVDPSEVETILRRKLRAKEYIKFKVDSSTIPISDKEAEEYFNANRLKFENLPFSSFKDTIKKYLTKQQLDRRMKDWFELLQSKHQIRNYLSE